MWVDLILSFLLHVFRRAVLVKESKESGGKSIDVTPEGFAVRSSAQEYGGGSFTVSRNMVIFSNYKDQRLYKQFIGGMSLLTDWVFHKHFVIMSSLLVYTCYFVYYVCYFKEFTSSCWPFFSLLSLQGRTYLKGVTYYKVIIYLYWFYYHIAFKK